MSKQELSIVALLLLLIIFLLNPFHFWMPDMMVMAAVASLVIIFGLYTVLLWREQPHDERESMHQLRAGRLAFFVGTLTLLFGMSVQILRSTLDPWLPLTLGAMVVMKAISFMVSRARY